MSFCLFEKYEISLTLRDISKMAHGCSRSVKLRLTLLQRRKEHSLHQTATALN